MTPTYIKLDVRIAWWVKPALGLVALIACIRPKLADRCIDVIVDCGIAVRPA